MKLANVMTRHELKMWPAPFDALEIGTKRYEIRKADRPFKVGDAIHYREWNPESEEYTGREAHARIIHLTAAGTWGLPIDLCVFGIKRVL